MLRAMPWSLLETEDEDSEVKGDANVTRLRFLGEGAGRERERGKVPEEGEAL